jgi:hypothetical protein
MSYLVTKSKMCDGPCGKYKKIYKSHGRLKYCKQCWMQHYEERTPNISQAKPKTRSRQRAQEEVQYSKLRRAFLTEHPNCQARLPGCSLRATQIHHKKGRTGDLYLDINFWLASCDNCHRIIEREVEGSKESGFSEDRLGD